MYSSKKEVDNHVRIALSKINSEKDRALRGLTIAKLYFKIKEYATAEQFICSYLGVKDDNDQAHKMLGQCYQYLKQPNKALQSFQRSLQLNPKQPELLAEICQLLVDNEHMNANKAKYWCELAESSKVENESVYALRMKLLSQANVSTNEIESILRKEISTRPNDVNPHVRLVRHFLDQQQFVQAFKYVHDLELQQNEAFSQSSEWYNTLWLVLSKYEQLSDTRKDWDFWLLVALCLERLVYLSFITCDSTSGSAVTETANLLFRFDQYLFKITQLSEHFQTLKELVSLFLEHYRSQLVLHAVALIFKRELMQKKNKWRETLKLAFPLLLLAYHTEPKENKEPWMKHCDEKSAKLIQLWYREGAFRCAQAGRILLSCITDDSKEYSKLEINSVFGSQPGALWSSSDELLAQIRQTCVDKQWRRNVFAQLFCNSDQKLKEQTSLLVKSSALAEPIYEIPSFATLQDYEETAQYLIPQSLKHIVYLYLTYGESLSQVSAKFFSGLNFSISNLSFCGCESLNQLDVDSYLYAAIIETQRSLQINRDVSDCYNIQGNKSANCRPRILTFVNMHADLCNDEQTNWWSIAYKVYKNLAKTDSAAQMRADLQTGIEVVRGINGPKMDMLIVFKLGKIFSVRAKSVRKPVERSFLEARTESLYLHGLKMLKLHNRGVLEPFRETFKYKANSASAERQLNEIAELAVIFLSDRFFKKSQYEELIDELSGVPLPFATYKQAEAYRKMEEASNTSKNAKERYSERAAECLQQTLALLKNTKFDINHPLNTTINTELKRVQNNSRKFKDENVDELSFLTEAGTTNHNNSSTYEDAQTEFFSPTLNRSRRDVLTSILAAANASPQQQSTHSPEMEALVKQMVNTLTLVKEELVCTIKPEVFSMRQEIVSLNAKVSQLEDSVKKMRTSSTPPSRDDGSNMLDDLYIIEDALQNQLYPQQSQQQSTPMFPNATGPNAAATNQYGNVMQQQQTQQTQRMHTPSALQQQQAAAVAAATAPFPMFNPNYALNYYAASPYMLAQQNAAANPLLAQRGQMGLPYMETSSSVNFNMTPTASLFPSGPTAQPTQPHVLNDGRTNNMYSLLNPSTQSTPPALQLPQSALPSLSLSSLSTMPLVQPTTTSPSMITAPSSSTFNKALNNQPVEKGPPANVVITSSDPLPNPRNATQLQQQQPTLSVTIPSHHIKPGLVQQTHEMTTSFTQQPASLPIQGQSNVFGNSSLGMGSGAFNFGSIGNNLSKQDSTSSFINNFSFKPAVEQALAANNSAASAIDAEKSSNISAPLNESTLNELNKTLDIESAEYDPRPDFQPIIPLPDEIEVRTGEEDEEIMFCEHAKLYRFVDKEWKERGVGTIKILKSKDGLSRILMRRDQTHKICANHKITKDLVLKPKFEKNGHNWAAPDFADGEMRSEIFYLRFKQQEQAQKFYDAFKHAQKEDESLNEKQEKTNKKKETEVPAGPFGLLKSPVTSFATSTPTNKTGNIISTSSDKSKVSADQQKPTTPAATNVNKPFSVVSNLTTKSTTTTTTASTTTTANPFANVTFSMNSSTQPFSGLSTVTSTTTTPTPFNANLFGKPATTSPFSVANLKLLTALDGSHQLSASEKAEASPSVFGTADSNAANCNLNKSNASDNEDEYVPTAQFNPVIPLPELIEVSTGEENYKQLFEHRAKLLRFDKETREWKERGIGIMKILQNKDDKDDVRLVMRREQIHKLCCNQRIYKDTEFKYAKTSQTALQWVGHDYSEGELSTEYLTLRFKTQDICKDFYDILMKSQSEMSKKAIMQADNGVDKPVEASSKAPSTLAPSAAIVSNETKGFGDSFKPKVGSWTCKGCYVINPADKLYCASCEEPKDFTVPKKDKLFDYINSGPFGLSKTGTNNFSFGTQTKSPETVNSSSITPAVGSTSLTNSKTTNDFGDKFKPKPGSWDCPDCYTNNTADKIYCIACEAPKDSSIPKKETTPSNNNKNILALSDPTKKFSFGFPTVTSTTQPVFTASQPVFGTSTTNPLTSLSKPSFTFNLQSKAMTTPAMPSDTGIALSAPFSLDKKEFTFTMSSKTSDADTPKFGDTDAADADDSSHLHEEEENNTYFAPVIPLPDKIEVTTGEEDEDILYQHRAKLYRFGDGEWKERGIGDVKILRHKTTKKLRVVMRRDQVHKICLNHALNDDVEYKSKDEKSWLFVVNDYSEGDLQLEKLSLRFKTKEIAEDFMKAVKKALADIGTETDKVKITSLNGHLKEKPVAALADSQQKITPTKKTDTVEKNRTEKAKVKSIWPLEQPELKLPNPTMNTSLENRSFSLKQSTLAKSPIKSDDTTTTKADNVANETSPINFSFTAALKENENTKAKAPASGGFLFGSGDLGNTGNKFEMNSSIFSGGAGNKPLFGQSPSIFGNLNISNATSASQNDAKNTGNNSKFIFGEKAVFGSAATPAAAPPPTATSIFGGGLTTEPKSTFFGIQTDTPSIFNATKIGTNTTGAQQSIFSMNNTNSNSTGVSLFGGTSTFANMTSTNNKNGSLFGTKTSDEKANNNATSVKPFSFAEITANKSDNLDFASLAASNNNNKNSTKPAEKPGPGGFFGLTNQDAFSSFQKSTNKTTNNNANANNVGDGVDDGAGEGGNDENYDPHYDPIIPLPKEIVVSTGEEDEEKIFSERATLFRFDADNKEWKERGVGEIKLLKHTKTGRFRILLRREQVHKLVLNFPITDGFKFNTMKNNPKSFVFAGMNFAESTEGAYEKLAIRFKKLEIATVFSNRLNTCLEAFPQKANAE